jgi:hypothetical protein
MKVTPIHILTVAVLITLFMVDVIALTSWVNFHNETRQQVLWSYEYHWNDWNSPSLPFSEEQLDTLGKGLVFYFKSVDSAYQNVTYSLEYQTYTDLNGNSLPYEISLSVTWTYQTLVCDVPKLLFIIFLSLLVLFLLFFTLLVRNGNKAADHEEEG